MRIRLLTSILVLLCCSKLIGQEDRRMNASYQSSYWVDVANDLEQSHGLKVYYNPDLDSALIDLTLTNATVNEVVELLQQATGLNFHLASNETIIATGQYVVKPAVDPSLFGLSEPTTTAASSSEANSVLDDIRETVEIDRTNRLENLLIEVGDPGQRFDGSTASFAGYVREANSGEPVVGASVFKRDPLVGAITDQYGYFTLTLPKGRYEIFFTSTGMKSTKRQVQLYSDGSVNIDLDEEIISLREVVVSGEKDVVENLQTGFASINMKNIKQVPTILGESDIMKIALTLPGVQTVGESAAGFNVRGGSADQNLVLFNDVPIYNTNHLFGFFSVFNPDVIANANLYKSGMGAHYGGRISSVFDVSMREGNKKRMTYKGGISPVTAKLTLEGPIKVDTTSYIIGIRGSYSDWILSFLNDPELRNSSGVFGDVAAKVSHTINDKNRIIVSGYFSGDRFKLDSDSLYRYFNSNGAIQWRHTFSNRLQAITSASIANFNYSLSSEANKVNAFDLRYDIGHYTLKTDFNYFPAEKTLIKFGATTTVYNLQPGKKEAVGDSSLVVPVTLMKEKGRESALYGGIEYEFNDRLSAYAGMRMTLFNSLGPGQSFLYQEGFPTETPFITDTITYSKNENIKSYVGPELRASARYKLTPTLSFKASYDRLNQYIHVLSNTVSISPIDAWRLSGAAIRPQTADQYSAGLYKTFLGSSLEVSVEGYYKESQNVLEYRDGSNLLLNEVIEADVIPAQGKAYGVEFLLKKQSGKFTGWLSYTFARSLLRTPSQFPSEQINGGDYYSSNFDIPHTAVLVSNYKINRRINVSLNVNYSTGRPTTYPIGQYTLRDQPLLIYTDRNQFRIPHYFRADLAVNLEGNHRVHKKIHGSWSLSIYNITSRANAYSVFFRSEGREIRGYKLSIFKDAIPTITYHFRRNR